MSLKQYIYIIFGQKLMAARQAQGLTQAQLGKIVNLSSVTVSNIERSAYNISLPMAFELASLTGLDLAEIYHEAKILKEKAERPVPSQTGQLIAGEA